MHTDIYHQFWFVRLVSMKLKSKAQEALSLLFQQDGVAPAVICDNAKEIILGDFNRNLKEASCHLKQMKPVTENKWSHSSLGQNKDNREIKEPKKGSGRKFIKSGTPMRLWDDCLELETYITSNTAHSIYKLDGEVPEMITSGKMSDISQFSELEWFEWVMF